MTANRQENLDGLSKGTLAKAGEVLTNNPFIDLHSHLGTRDSKGQTVPTSWAVALEIPHESKRQRTASQED